MGLTFMMLRPPCPVHELGALHRRVRRTWPPQPPTTQTAWQPCLDPSTGLKGSSEESLYTAPPADDVEECTLQLVGQN